MAHNDRDLRSAHGWSRCGSETKGFSEAAARICGYVEIYRGIYVNPHVQRSDLHKSSLPINLQVNPDRSTEIAMEKKTGSPAPAGRRDFSLCKAFRLNSNIAEGASRISKLEKKRFYEISRSSLVEMDTQFEIAIILDYYKQGQMAELEQYLESTFRRLSKMIENLNLNPTSH